MNYDELVKELDFLTRDEFLSLYGDVDWKIFASKYGIEAFNKLCENCGAIMATTIPILSKTRAGLKSPDCACGNTNSNYCHVRRNDIGE